MGGRIDRAALFIATTAAAYLFFLNAWHSVAAACAAAFAACALGRRVLRGLPRRRRCGRRQIEAEILRIAAMPDDEAARALGEWVRGRYPGEAFALTPILKHPAASLSPSDILGAWKAGRGAARLVIAATCACDPAAALYARSLREPAVAVVDRRALARILRKSGRLPAEAEAPLSPKDVLRRLVRRAAGRRPRPRDALAATGLLAMYRFVGQPLYLLAALILLFRLGAALAARPRGWRLFE